MYRFSAVRDTPLNVETCIEIFPLADPLSMQRRMNHGAHSRRHLSRARLIMPVDIVAESAADTVLVTSFHQPAATQNCPFLNRARTVLTEAAFAAKRKLCNDCSTSQSSLLMLKDMPSAATKSLCQKLVSRISRWGSPSCRLKNIKGIKYVTMKRSSVDPQLVGEDPY